MSIASQTSRVQYVLTSLGQTLTVPWYFLESGHVGVVRGKGTGEVRLTLNTHYTVNGAGNMAGGSIKLTNAAAAVGDRITLFRDGPFTQPNDYPLAGQFPAATIEETDDASTMIDQQLRLQTERSLRVSIAEEPILPIKGGLVPNGVIGVDENGNPISWHKDDFKGDKGDQGEQGPAGGPMGPMGPEGIQGPQGDDGVHYWLELDAAAVNRATNGAFTPNQINARALKREGDGPVIVVPCSLKVHDLVNGTWNEVHANAGWAGSGGFGIGVNAAAVRYSIYKAGAFAELLDQRLVPIVRDGQNSNPPPPAPAPDTYELELSHSSTIRYLDWSFPEMPNLTVKAWRKPNGTGAKVAYNGRFKIELQAANNSYVQLYQSGGNESQKVLATSSSWQHDMKAIRVQLYKTGGGGSVLQTGLCQVFIYNSPPAGQHSLWVAGNPFTWWSMVTNPTGNAGKPTFNGQPAPLYMGVAYKFVPAGSTVTVKVPNKVSWHNPNNNSSGTNKTHNGWTFGVGNAPWITTSGDTAYVQMNGPVTISAHYP